MCQLKDPLVSPIMALVFRQFLVATNFDTISARKLFEFPLLFYVSNADNAIQAYHFYLRLC